MQGELRAVWSEVEREIWTPLFDGVDVPPDVYCELYRELANALRQRPSIEVLADVIDDPVQGRTAFEATTTNDLGGESTVASFFEAAHQVLDDIGGDVLSNRYFNLLDAFILKFSLRYDLRRPCTLCPTLTGVFASLLRDLRVATGRDAHLDGLMRDFEGTIRDLRLDQSDGRIKSCIQKQMNLLEALGRSCPGITGMTLGAICNQLGTWPHEGVKEAMKSLYGFASDYPGIRHGGTPNNAIRAIEMRDLVAVSILLAGFTPYLTDQLDADAMYRGE